MGTIKATWSSIREYQKHLAAQTRVGELNTADKFLAKRARAARVRESLNRAARA